MLCFGDSNSLLHFVKGQYDLPLWYCNILNYYFCHCMNVLSLASETVKITYGSLCHLLSNFTEIETNIRSSKMSYIWFEAFVATGYSGLLGWTLISMWSWCLMFQRMSLSPSLEVDVHIVFWCYTHTQELTSIPAWTVCRILVVGQSSEFTLLFTGPQDVFEHPHLFYYVHDQVLWT